MQKIDLFRNIHRIEEILLRFSGEAHDDIASKRNAGHNGFHIFNVAQNLIAVIFALHCRENAVASALQGEMEARHDSGRICKLIAEALRHHGRLQRARTHTLNAVDHRCLRHQSGQRIATEVLAVGSRLNARQNDLSATVLRNCGNLLQYVLGRAGNNVTSRLFDNTVCTMVITAVFDLDITTVTVCFIHRHRFQCRSFHVQNSAFLFLFTRADKLCRKFRNGKLIAISANVIHTGNRRNLFRLDLRKASHDQNECVGICYRRAADHLTGFAFGFRRHRTGIDNIYVTNVRK